MLKLCAWALATTFPSNSVLPGMDRLDPLPFLRQFRREAPFIVRLTLYLSVLVLLLTPILTMGIPLPAVLLSSARLQRHVAKLSVHRVYLLRQTMLMVKTIGGLAWGAHPEVRKALRIPVYAVDPGTWRA